MNFALTRDDNLYRALKVEEFTKDRVDLKIKKTKDKINIKIKAKDTIALKAATMSLLRLMNIYEKLKNLKNG